MKLSYDNKVMSSGVPLLSKYSQKTIGSSFMACDFQVTTFVHVEVIFVACFTSTQRNRHKYRIFFACLNATSELEQP